MTDDTDICGAPTGDGGACQLPASRDDGRCHHHTDAADDDSGGRPSKLTKQRQESIASMIEQGHSIAAAARSNGITVQTFFNWMEQGQQQDQGIFADFFDRITRARGVGEATYLDAIREIAKESGDTATLMTLIKSRYPDSWGDAKRGEQSGGVQVVLPEDADPPEQ